MTDKQHALLMSIRQALIMILGAIEDYLGKQRSIVPKHKRPKRKPETSTDKLHMV